MQRPKPKMAYGCQIKMAQKSDDEEEIRINQKKSKVVIYGMYEKKK